MARGSLYIWLNRDDEAIRTYESYRPFFRRLAHSFLPPPAFLAVGNRKPSKITGYDGPALVKALDKAKDNLTLTSEDESLKILLWPLDGRTAVSIYFNPDTAEQNRTLFLQLSEAIEPTYGLCHLYSAMEALNAQYYKVDRTFYASGLFWLNIFGPEEEARQGGPALEHNPYARADRFPFGLVIQVCDSPEEAATPEGIERLVKATQAMPPLPGKTPQPIPADHITIAGVSGFYGSGNTTFWITKNIVPPAPLDPKSIEAIRRVRESKAPPVSQVRVLFSLKEAAELNKPILQELAESWYVSAETGQPAKA
jgi:hypothetical protein